MVVLGYGITLDVDNLAFAVLDRDDSAASRDYVEQHRRLALFRPSGRRWRLPPTSTGVCAAASWRWRSRSRPASGATSRAGARRRSACGWTAPCRSGARPSAATCRAPIRTIWPGCPPRRRSPARARRHPRDALPLQPGFPEPRRHGAGHHRAAAAVRPGDPDRAGGGAGEGARLDHQSLRDPGDPPRVPARQAAAVRGHRDGELRHPDGAGRVRVRRPDQGQPGRARRPPPCCTSWPPPDSGC